MNQDGKNVKLLPLVSVLILAVVFNLTAEVTGLEYEVEAWCNANQASQRGEDITDYHCVSSGETLYEIYYEEYNLEITYDKFLAINDIPKDKDDFIYVDQKLFLETTEDNGKSNEDDSGALRDDVSIKEYGRSMNGFQNISGKPGIPARSAYKRWLDENQRYIPYCLFLDWQKQLEWDQQYYITAEKKPIEVVTNPKGGIPAVPSESYQGEFVHGHPNLINNLFAEEELQSLQQELAELHKESGIILTTDLVSGSKDLTKHPARFVYGRNTCMGYKGVPSYNAHIVTNISADDEPFTVHTPTRFTDDNSLDWFDHGTIDISDLESSLVEADSQAKKGELLVQSFEEATNQLREAYEDKETTTSEDEKSTQTGKSTEECRLNYEELNQEVQYQDKRDSVVEKLRTSSDACRSDRRWWNIRSTAYWNSEETQLDATISTYIEGYEENREALLSTSYGFNLRTYLKVNGHCDKIRGLKNSMQSIDSTTDEYEEVRKIARECNQLEKESNSCETLRDGESPAMGVTILTEGYDDAGGRRELAIEAIEAHNSVQINQEFSDRFTWKVFTENVEVSCKDEEFRCQLKRGRNKFKQICDTKHLLVFPDEDIRSYRLNDRAFISNAGFFQDTNDYLRFDHLVLHEGGHLFYDLADEYVEEGKGSRPDAPNCFNYKERGLDYWRQTLDLKDEKLDPESGCSYTENNYQGTGCTLMESSECGNDFGPINRRYIETKIFKSN